MGKQLYTFSINTNSRCELISVDHLLTESIQKSHLSEGALIAFVPHTTAGITINENADPAVKHDLLISLERKIPFSEGYTHIEGNSAAHIKTTLVGSSVLVPVSGGRLQLGTWQSVFFAEFDGPRRRSLWVTTLSGQPD
ncbi:secondary thiamine-phosphate synthase enzyme YjbQ [bacterium]|nr:secondary thiamine-phosphate synthase enzyme YjbQ [bacterium]MBU1652660.1 secondary thiamine-phosphate synthase enzyme YjbQ [bacterium]MBU1880566.1 secondary thiamine-phosphate synthase enzyme YjbQ [bacterium]